MLLWRRTRSEVRLVLAAEDMLSRVEDTAMDDIFEHRMRDAAASKRGAGGEARGSHANTRFKVSL